jgi:hypothetical protein
MDYVDLVIQRDSELGLTFTMTNDDGSLQDYSGSTLMLRFLTSLHGEALFETPVEPVLIAPNVIGFDISDTQAASVPMPARASKRMSDGSYAAVCGAWELKADESILYMGAVYLQDDVS